MDNLLHSTMVSGSHETRVWIKESAIDAVNCASSSNGTVKKSIKSQAKKISNESSNPVIVRTTAPWNWKIGIMVENSAAAGVVVKLAEEGSSSKDESQSKLPSFNRKSIAPAPKIVSEAIRLPADALKKGQVLLANTYPKAKDGSMICPDDLISLTHLHEASVIECLISRYDIDIIYTYTGPILLALNPFHKLKDLYSDATMKKYWHHAEQNSNDDLPPHVFAVADTAFRSMMRKLEMMDKETPTRCDQSILVSGESGAGKTVTMKFAMKYLAALSQRLSEFHAKHGRPGYLGIGKKGSKASHNVTGKKHTDPLAIRGHTFSVKNQPSPYAPVLSPRQNKDQGESIASSASLSLQTDSIENQVLQSNPILESFGNARTVRNDNSSRFGKFIELQFTRYGKLVGAQIQVYLLEKVRLVHQTKGERNFHIFFEFMSGGMDFRELKNYYLTSKHTPSDFKITANGTYGRRDGVPDSDTYRELRRAMNVMKFSPDVQKNIFNVTAAILHASNMSFKETNGGESGVDESNEHLEAVCDLLKVTTKEMTQSLCHFSITVGKDTKVRKSLSKEKAEHGFQALLKALYGALFTYLVQRINDSIAYKKGSDHETDDPMHVPASFIGILDIFGFESFQINSFEQLCINYCNERLQMQFSSFILKNEQKEYSKEGIKWDFIDFSENQDVLDLIENRGTGILGVLDDMCRAPGATDRGFADTLYKQCATSPCFIADKKQTALLKFTIHHYAGPVEYTADGFVEKNRDELPKESTEFLKKSENEFVQELGRIIEGSVNVADRSSGDKSRKSATTVGGSFRDQLKSLRLKIEKTAPCYIRCLKPNDLLIPNDFEIPIVAEQLRCGGVLEAVRVARAGFPQHYSHPDFVRRYRPLVWREWQKTVLETASNITDVCKNLIDVLFKKLQQLEKAEKKTKATEVVQDGPGFVKLGMQMGKTKVFLRQKEFEGLERQRGHEQQKAAIKLNATFRAYLVRVMWAAYVPLLRKEKTDHWKDREQKLFELKVEQDRMDQSLSDLAAKFSGSSDQLLGSGRRDLVASKVGSRNPGNRAGKKGPQGEFKWAELENGTWGKKYKNEE